MLNSGEHEMYTEGLKKPKKRKLLFFEPRTFLVFFIKSVKSAGNGTLPLSIPKTGVFIDNGHHQLRIRDLIFFARGVPTNILSVHI